MAKRTPSFLPSGQVQGDLWHGEVLPRECDNRQPRLIASDGLIAERVNSQTIEKHKCLTGFIELTSPARRLWLGSGHAGATLIDLFRGVEISRT
jgi:hypothetical protein